MKTCLRYLLLTSVCLLLIPLHAQAQTYSTENGRAEFTSSVPLHEFTGVSDYLTGLINIEENLVDFFLDLETLKTGNGRRDRDMYRTLQTDDFPFAEFTGSLISSFDHNSTKQQNVQVTGEFTIHGVPNEMTIEGTLQRQGNELLLKANWVHDITDHEIEPPGILFYRVRDEMDVQIEARLNIREDE